MKTTWQTERNYAAAVQTRNIDWFKEIRVELTKQGFTDKQIDAAIEKYKHLI